MNFYTVDDQDKADFFASLTVDDVTAALATGADPNERDDKNVAPLHCPHDPIAGGWRVIGSVSGTCRCHSADRNPTPRLSVLTDTMDNRR